MTMGLTFAALLAAVHFGRKGRTRDLYWLAFLAGQGVTYQRAFAFLASALMVLVWRQWPVIWRKLPQVILYRFFGGRAGPGGMLCSCSADWLWLGWLCKSGPRWWEWQLGTLRLAEVAPGVVSLSPVPETASPVKDNL